MRNTAPLTVTVGIPTYYGGRGLVKTVKSILASTGVEPFRLIVCVDGNPLQKEVENALGALGVEIIFSQERGGQRARIKQMLDVCTTDVLILTQDDVLFSPDAIRHLLGTFESYPEATMLSGHGEPLPAKSFFESVIQIGMMISECVGKQWRGGDNYLRVGGRCLAFRAGFMRTLDIAEEVLSSDANFYFLNEKNNGVFRHVDEAVYFVRSPQTIVEHLKQSRKYQLISKEIQRDLDLDIGRLQPIPLGLLSRVAFLTFFQHPVRVSC